MSRIDASQASGVDLDRYRTCPNCGAEHLPEGPIKRDASGDPIYPLPERPLKISGDGRWKNTITCLKCFHIQEGVPWKEVVIPLIAEEYALSYDDALEIERQGHKEYAQMVAQMEAETLSGV